MLASTFRQPVLRLFARAAALDGRFAQFSANAPRHTLAPYEKRTPWRKRTDIERQVRSLGLDGLLPFTEELVRTGNLTPDVGREIIKACAHQENVLPADQRTRLGRMVLDTLLAHDSRYPIILSCDAEGEAAAIRKGVPYIKEDMLWMACTMFGRCGDAEGPAALVANVIAQGFWPGIWLMNYVIRAYCLMGNYPAAMSTLENLSQLGIEPQKATFTEILKLVPGVVTPGHFMEVVSKFTGDFNETSKGANEPLWRRGMPDEMRLLCVQAFIAASNDDERLQLQQLCVRMARGLASDEALEDVMHHAISLLKHVRECGVGVAVACPAAVHVGPRCPCAVLVCSKIKSFARR